MINIIKNLKLLSVFVLKEELKLNFLKIETDVQSF
jgi:hypothetical protein